jgi:hypothetical protein
MSKNTPKDKKAEVLDNADQFKALYGSSTLPGHIVIDEGKEVQLGAVVSAAFERSGLTVDLWNAMSEIERDGLLNYEIELMKSDGNSDSAEEKKPVAIKTTTAPTPELIALKLTAAVAIDGQVFRKDSVVHLTETEAKRLLHRGKAELATEE